MSLSIRPKIEGVVAVEDVCSDGLYDVSDAIDELIASPSKALRYIDLYKDNSCWVVVYKCSRRGKGRIPCNTVHDIPTALQILYTESKDLDTVPERPTQKTYTVCRYPYDRTKWCLALEWKSEVLRTYVKDYQCVGVKTRKLAQSYADKWKNKNDDEIESYYLKWDEIVRGLVPGTPEYKGDDV